MDQLSRKMGKSAPEITKHNLQALQDYHWPGNVRELKNMLESTLITGRFDKLKFDLPKMTDENAVAVLNSLLKNIYRSFDFREEEDVYDRLATSVSGDLLSEIYLQNRKSMVVTQAGGARARVKEVEILNVDATSVDDRPLGLLFHARWTTPGKSPVWNCWRKSASIHMRIRRRAGTNR